MTIKEENTITKTQSKNDDLGIKDRKNSNICIEREGIMFFENNLLNV